MAPRRKSVVLIENATMNLSYSQDCLLELPPQILSEKNALVGLNLGHSSITDDDLPALANAAKVCRCLESLCLSHNALSDDSMELICSVVGTLEATLTSLDVGLNAFTPLGGRALGECLTTNDRVEECRVGKAMLPVQRFKGGAARVDVSQKLFTAIDGALVARLTSTSLSDLETVCLSGHPLPMKTLLFGQDEGPNELDLARTRLGAADAWVVAGALEADLRPGLRRLVLDGNAVCASGAFALGVALRRCRCLGDLSLNSCQLTDDGHDGRGVEAIGEALRHNPALASLAMRDNDIGEGLVVTLAAALTSDGVTALDLRDNPFADGAGGRAIAFAVARSRRLASLNGMNVDGGGVADFRRHQSDGFQVFEMDFLAARLVVSAHVRCLKLDGNQLGAPHLARLAGALPRARHLESLSLKDNRLSGLWFDRAGNAKGTYDGSGRDEFAAYLRDGSPLLRRLDLRRSGIDDRGDVLAEALFGGHSILEEFNGIDLRTGASDYAAAEPGDERPRVPVLDLGHRAGGLPSLECAFIARAVMDQEELLTLEAPDNGDLERFASEALAAALKSPKTLLRRLVLDGTQLQSDGALALFQALATNAHLEVLDCSRCAICLAFVGKNRSRSVAPAEACAAMLASDASALQHLKLKRNDLRSDGGDVVAAALASNDTLLTLSLAGNELRTLPSLADALRNNATLEALDLGDNDITAKGPAFVVGVCRALATNAALTRLDLTGSGIDDDVAATAAKLEPAAVAICDCLRRNPRIMKITL